MLQLATAPARFLLDELGQGAWKAVGTFRPLVARYGLKNVPTPIEIIAELLVCHARGRGFEPRRSRQEIGEKSNA